MSRAEELCKRIELEAEQLKAPDPYRRREADATWAAEAATFYRDAYPQVGRGERNA